MINGHAADRAELLVAPLPRSDVAGIDPVLVERPRAVGKPRQQQVTVVMEIADQRCGAAGVEHALLDFRDRRRRFRPVDRHPHHLGSRFGQIDTLLRGRSGVGRIGQRHRLHDDRRAAANLDVADSYASRPVQLHQ